MSIETVSGMNKMLSQFNSQDWTKAASIDKATLPNLPELPSTAQVPEGQKSFSQMLADQITEVNSLQTEANKAIQNLVTGKSKNIQETMLAVERADIAFKAMNQVRMKVIEAYKEIMRMQT